MWAGSTLQSRDPFSGDCDQEPHPVSKDTTEQGLAEPRPVLRGLRPSDGRQLSGAVPQPCRAETRSQGIATLWALTASMRDVCLALQSRDPFSGDCDRGLRRRDLGHRGNLAEPRPVFRGLRRGHVHRPEGVEEGLLAEPRPVLRGLQRKGKAKGARGSNTCFREIATRRLTPQETSITLGASGAGFPQCGDPFAGDCDTTRMKVHCSSVSS